MSDTMPIAASVDELLDLVAHHVGTVVGVMTPDLARALMRLNQGNRRKKARNVARYAEIARSGGWINSGEPVIISREGILNDGQHRLQAIIDSGVSVPMDVRFGVPREVFQQMGSGARRTACQTLASLGEAYSPTQAAIAKLLLLHDKGHLAANRPAIETPDIVRLVKADRNIFAVSKAIRGTKRLAPMLSAGFGFPLVLAARVAPIERVLEFIDLVSTGLSDSPHRPARALHQRLVDSLSRNEKLGAMEIATITGRCWNAWVEDRDIKVLRVHVSDRTGENFPQIIGMPA